MFHSDSASKSHRTQRPLIIGHRGAMGLAPENTLVAVQRAIDLGVDGVELDVRRTADGFLVVFHDEDVDRTTNGSGMLHQLSLKEVKALDAGSSFDARFAGERVPTLREVFDLLQACDVMVHLELKDAWVHQGIEQQVIDLIREYGLVERVEIHSFYLPALHTAYQLAPDIFISELWYHKLPDDDETHFKAIGALYELHSVETIAQIHQRGQRVWAWTVNDVETAQWLIAAGVDGMTTDYPDQLLPVVRSTKI